MDNILVVALCPLNPVHMETKMIKCTNDAEGLEVIRKGDRVHFIGHFGGGLKAAMVLSVDDARTMFGDTGTIDVTNGGRHAGLISYEPQGSEIIFSREQLAVAVDSEEFKREVEEALDAT